MQIQLINFGCYENKTYEFPRNQFLLINALNGAGKSTIFKGICWALYDKQKTVRHGQEVCQVVFTDNDFTVTRISKPKSLKLKWQGKSYEGTTAQDIIIDKILNMNWEQFCLSTMINTATRCSLASITPGERFKVIGQLVSTQDEPKIDLEKLKAYEVSLGSGANVAQGELDAYKKQVEKLEQSLDTDIASQKPIKFDPVKFKELKTQLSTLQHKKEKWLNVLSKGLAKDEAERKLEQLNMTGQVKKKIKQMQANLQYVTHLEQRKTTKIQFEKGKIKHFADLQKELDHLIDIKSFPEDVLTTLGATSEARSACALSNEMRLKKWSRETEIRKDQRDEGNPYWDKSPEEIKKVHSTLYIVDLKKAKQECPSCSADITIQDGRVIKWNKKWDEQLKCCGEYSLDKLLTCEYEWDEKAGEKWEETVKRRNRIKELHRMIDGQVLSNELIRMKKSFGEEISPPGGFNSSKGYTVEYLQDRISTLTKQLGSFPDESERSILEEIVGMKKFPTRAQINELSSSINTLEEEIETMMDQEKQYNEYQMVKKTQDQIDELKREISEIETRTGKLREETIAINRLKQLQKEAETMSMEHVVATLNVYASEYLAKFFTDSIKAEMTLTKKTAKETKLGLDMDIEYDGQKFDINEFSQGELIKINLAFILAMNRLQNSRYLFLDEVLQNLDKDVILEIYECLKELSLGLSIFVIQHNSIEGFFDKMIKIEKTN